MTQIAKIEVHVRLCISSVLQIDRSRHTVVCGAAQENGVHAIHVSILTGTTKLHFSRILYSMIFYSKNTKVALEVPAYQGRLHIKFEQKVFPRYE